MIEINKSPALAGKRVPINDEQAAGRVAELMSESYEGLIGSIFDSLDQLAKGLQDGGWHLEPAVYASNESATTWIGTCSRRERTFKMLLNSYGTSIEICNCWGGKDGDNEPAPVPKAPKPAPVESPKPKGFSFGSH